MAGFNIQEIRFGPSKILLGPIGSEVELGHTDNGALITFENRFEPVNVDEWGDMMVDGIHLGTPCTVEILLKQFGLDQIENAIFGASREVGGTTSAIHVGARPGTSMEASSQRIRIHELAVAADADETRDVAIHKVVPIGIFSPRYSTREPALVSVVFGGLVDPTKVAPELFMAKIFDAT